MSEHLNITIHGEVVGVNFRQSAKEFAQSLGLNGFAGNASENSVYLEVEGEQQQLGEFVDWCHKGNAWSKVKNVNVSKGEMKNFTEFKRV